MSPAETKLYADNITLIEENESLTTLLSVMSKKLRYLKASFLNLIFSEKTQPSGKKLVI